MLRGDNGRRPYIVMSGTGQVLVPFLVYGLSGLLHTYSMPPTTRIGCLPLFWAVYFVIYWILEGTGAQGAIVAYGRTRTHPS